MAAGLLAPKTKTKGDRESTETSPKTTASNTTMAMDDQQKTTTTTTTFSTLDAAEVGLMDVVKDVFEEVVDVAALLKQS